MHGWRTGNSASHTWQAEASFGHLASQSGHTLVSGPSDRNAKGGVGERWRKVFELYRINEDLFLEE